MRFYGYGFPPEVRAAQERQNQILNQRAEDLQPFIRRRSWFARFLRFPLTVAKHFKITRRFWLSVRLASITLRSVKPLNREPRNVPAELFGLRWRNVLVGVLVGCVVILVLVVVIR